MSDNEDRIVGPVASAGRVRAPYLTLDQQATVAAWLILAPGQSPAWSHYLLGVVHLRPIEGVAPPNITSPGATHELLLVALDPKRSPDPHDLETLVPLSPANACVQFTVLSDEQADDLARTATRAICDGLMPAEPLFQGYGQRLWAEAVALSAEHLRTGGEHRPPAISDLPQVEWR